MSVDAARATADKLGSSHERPRIRLLDWQGSADLRTLADANCLAFFPPGNREYTVDDPIDVRLL
jgi:molybdopterin biosynthesis enzyme